MSSATRSFLFFFIAFFPILIRAQMPADDAAQIVKQVHDYSQKNTNTHSVHLQKSCNPVKAFLFLTLYFYQKVLSEQISGECGFERTCSGFSITAIQEFGFVKGISLSADRLTRCNGQAQIESQEYLINHSNGKTIDEPWMYRFKE